MKANEAIKYLQQLYPNGGHCWLDEQRIEAISMAIKALQEEPVSNDLEEEIQKTIHNHFFDLNGIAIAGTSVYATVDDMVYIAKHFAKWQKEQMVKEVDLEGISKNYALNNSPWDDCMLEMQNAFKDGFELGLKAQKG